GKTRLVLLGPVTGVIEGVVNDDSELLPLRRHEGVVLHLPNVSEVNGTLAPAVPPWHGVLDRRRARLEPQCFEEHLLELAPPRPRRVVHARAVEDGLEIDALEHDRHLWIG